MFEIIAYEYFLFIIKVNFKGRNIQCFSQRFVGFLFAEGAMIEGSLFVFIDSMRIDVINDYSQRIIPIPFEALDSDMNIVNVDDCIIYDPY